MRDLRLIGVHDDGEHLVVTDDTTGEEYRLRIDEPLRAAARRDRPRLGQLQIAIDNDVRPREVQAMIRAGATADEVSARTGWDLDKIARFEGPVLAEREHVAELAQTVRMRGATPSGSQETLAERARTRFAGRDVDSSTVAWDARRNAEGQWTVSATFTAGGRERTATWWFDLSGMSVVAKNDEAKWLSEAEAPDGPVPSAVHRPTAVFDVEVEESRAERAQRADPDELIASMREHSGARSRRRGGRKRSRAAEASTDHPDALPFETEERPPAARGQHPKDPVEQTQEQEPAPDAESAAPAEQTSAPTESSAQTEPETAAEPETTPSEDDARPTTSESPTSDQDTPDEDAGDSTEDDTRESEAAEQQQDGAEQDEQNAPSQEPAPEPKAKSGRGRGRKGRASVPSWDDVMFGTTRD